MRVISLLCLTISAVAGALVVYSLLYRDAIDMDVVHTRIVVEMAICIGFGFASAFTWPS